MISTLPHFVNSIFRFKRNHLPSEPISELVCETTAPPGGEGNGYVAGSPCIFPFYDKDEGEIFVECATKGKSTEPWCATEDGWDPDKKWGLCGTCEVKISMLSKHHGITSIFNVIEIV